MVQAERYSLTGAIQHMTMIIPTIDGEFFDRLQRAAPDVKFVTATKEDELLSHARDAEAVFGFNSEKFFEAATQLNWVQSGSAGIERYPLQLFKERGIVLTNTKEIYGVQLADHTLALILAFSRQLPFLLRAQS